MASSPLPLYIPFRPFSSLVPSKALMSALK
jgi:hypothetical protein